MKQLLNKLIYSPLRKIKKSKSDVKPKARRRPQQDEFEFSQCSSTVVELTSLNRCRGRFWCRHIVANIKHSASFQSQPLYWPCTLRPITVISWFWWQNCCIWHFLHAYIRFKQQNAVKDEDIWRSGTNDSVNATHLSWRSCITCD